MNRATFAIVIGVLSCIAHIILFGFGISGCLYLSQHQEQVKHYGTAITIIIASAIFNAIMCAISGLMIMGVQKKRQEYIGPWVILGAVGIICSIINFFIHSFQLPVGQLITSLVLIALSCLVWYPIYTLWRDMRNGAYSTPYNQQHLQTQQHQPSQPAYYAPPPVYPAAVGDGNQGDYTPVPQKV